MVGFSVVLEPAARSSHGVSLLGRVRLPEQVALQEIPHRLGNPRLLQSPLFIGVGQRTLPGFGLPRLLGPNQAPGRANDAAHQRQHHQ